jgi:hypothetical protein
MMKKRLLDEPKKLDKNIRRLLGPEYGIEPDSGLLIHLNSFVIVILDILL